MRIAIIGSGVAGLTCAHLLSHEHDLTLFESDARAGGHAHTVSVLEGGTTLDVDTGFIVYNERNYPLFTRILCELGVASRPSEMSFAVADEDKGVEWSGSSLASVFAQPRNLARPAFLRMLSDIVRFNRAARELVHQPVDLEFSLADFLATQRWSEGFLDWYLIPMGAAIWSCDPSVFTQFPAASFARFFDNHGLLGLGDRPEWRTIVGGSKRYVQAITAPLGERVRLGTSVTKVVRRRGSVEIATSDGALEHFDHVIVATHSNQALRVLADPTAAEREVLGSIRYQRNVATLHRDETLLPRHRRARASWNWHQGTARHAPTLTYDLSRLQGLATSTPICLTLNRPEAVRDDLVLETMTYHHPVFDAPAMRSQLRRDEISDGDVSYVGAYWGYGFHEDGARSAVEVCTKLGSTWAKGGA